MPRISLIAVLTLLIVVILLAGAGLVLGAAGSLHPGSALFALQYGGEQVSSRLFLSPATRANAYLDLLDRRIGDLKRVMGEPGELDAVVFLDAALDQAVRAIKAASDLEQVELINRLSAIASQLDQAASELTILPATSPKTYFAFHDKVSTLQIMLDYQRLARVDYSRLAGILLPPPTTATSALNLIRLAAGETQDLSHGSFSLLGRHILLECQVCHTDVKNAKYSTAGTDCKSCHTTIKPEKPLSRRMRFLPYPHPLGKSSF